MPEGTIMPGIETQEAADVKCAALELANDPELVQEFLSETREHLVRAEAGILALERDPDDPEPLNLVFRCFHTIKGLSAFLGAAAVHEIAHETENILDLARSGRLTLSPDITDLILRAADELIRCLAHAGPGNLHLLPRCDPALLSAIACAGRMPQAGAAAAAGDDLPAVQRPEHSEPAGSGNEESAVRVTTAKLEHLIDMVGELVIASSGVSQHPAVGSARDPVLARNITHLVRVLKEVQKTSLSMRMVAVGTLFRRMSRLTRDLSRRSGKKIDLVTSGDDVELDRNMVEELADPMVHMIRNAVDHGLESTSERIEAGKPETGIIRLRAMHDAGDVVFEIGDDGRGLDRSKILARARRMGLAGEQEQPDDDTVFRLIFAAGFSTVDKVTDMSGRGVGMDVVTKQIQKLRGSIQIRSVLGKGCTFALRVPLTLAIIDGLVVGVGSERYILPMFAVREILASGDCTFVTLENRAEAALLRESLLPVIRLGQLFADGEAHADAVLIVVESRGRLLCIAVDELIGKHEVVIKSLGKTFRDVPALSGGAILGDGRVGLIIDVNSLAYRH
ncbi:MAG: chemotaxis protein CheA [Acidobacteriota bacterium]|nr:chemotaxis protein CheA [Acidobacteriota bacterium]